jgi:hypothetical protein
MFAAQRYFNPITQQFAQYEPNLSRAMKLWRDKRHHPVRMFEEFMILIIEDNFSGVV